MVQIPSQSYISQSLESDSSTHSASGYLLLSLISGLLETGIFTSAATTHGLVWGLAGALAYQMGCLARNPLRLHPLGTVAALAIAALLGTVNLGWPNIDNQELWLIETLLVSAGIQSAREWLLPDQSPVPVWRKRLFRVAGFTFGIVIVIFPFITPNSLALVTTLTTIGFLMALWRGKIPRLPWQGINPCWNSGRMGWVMLTHQIHYFAYVYVLLYVLLRLDKVNAEHQIQNVLLGATLFAFGWGTYISGECLLKSWLRLTPRAAIICGHCWVAIGLAFMILYLDNIILVGTAWVLAGFGGGSVYAIKTVAKEYACSADLELWEHLGHVIGVLLTLLLIACFPSVFQAPFLLAFAAATGVVLRLGCIKNEYCHVKTM